MDEPAQNKTTIPWLRRPWFPESVFFFIVLWQESFRLSARTAHSVLPVSKPLQDFYYYNSGDFVNGYVMAFLLDGISNLIFFKKRKTLSVEGLRLTVQGSAVIASLLSAIVVIIYEMSGSSSTTADIRDIPAGIFGAMVYFVIRLIALRTSYEKNRLIQ